MIRQSLNVNDKWKVVIYYNVDYNLFNIIREELRGINIKEQTINRVYYTMSSNEAKAVTISNLRRRVSVILFNKHSDKYDYINSIVHESEHVKQAMFKFYNIKHSGENPAYTMGYLVSKMLMKIKECINIL